MTKAASGRSLSPACSGTFTDMASQDVKRARAKRHELAKAKRGRAKSRKRAARQQVITVLKLVLKAKR